MADVLSAGGNLTTQLDVAAIRARFSSLQQEFTFFDAHAPARGMTPTSTTLTT